MKNILHPSSFILFTAVAAVMWLLTGSADTAALCAVAPAAAPSADAEAAMAEIGKGLGEFRKALEGKATKEEIQKALADIGSIRTENEELKKQLNANAKLLNSLSLGRDPNYNPADHGRQLSPGCARWLGSLALTTGAAAGKAVPDNVLNWCREYLDTEMHRFEKDVNGPALRKFVDGISGIHGKASLTTSEIPLPVDYQAEVFHLVKDYGSFRRYARIFPMGAGDVTLKKTNSRPAFNFTDMSGSVSEKAPSLSDVTLSAKKAGGIIIIPREIDEDSIVAMGQFLGEYIAEQVAAWEDTVGWLADGSGTYKTLEGVTDRVSDNSKLVTLTSGETATDDITLADLRALRGLTNAGVYRQDPAYYLHTSMEALLASFNTGGTQYWNPTNMTLEGYPVRWVDVLSPYSSTAVASTVVALWGSMRYWVLGTRGGLRVDSSEHYKFGTDELALRALWRFTVEEMNTEHMAGIKTAAS